MYQIFLLQYRMMKTLGDIEHLQGVKVLVRADFNVPIKNGSVAEDFRIRMTLPTIDYLRNKGAKVILISHLESIDGKNESLRPIADHLKKLGEPVTFIENLKNALHVINSELKDGECVLLENLRFNEGEKANDAKFAKELASLGDIYVNEGFSVSHREHASIVGVPKILPSYAGLEFEKEVTNLSRAFDPAHPFLFILGGAKFETKLPLLEKFMETADMVFVGGALANDFFKEKGYEIGRSLVSEELPRLNLGGLTSADKLMLPVDVVNENREVKAADGLSSNDKIMDAGPQTLELLKERISSAKFILWNGPLGLYEDGYREPTLKLAKMIAEATEKAKSNKQNGNREGVESVVGGGDTLAGIAELGIGHKFTFVSIAGGAMLDFLAKETLPGIEALNSSKV